jgi:hypothetical protein
LSYKFLNIVAAMPAGDHANPQGTEWLRQHVSSLPGTASEINRKGSAPHWMPGGFPPQNTFVAGKRPS